MKITLDRVNENFHFQLKNERGHIVDVDNRAEFGGNDLGASPMELVLMGVAGCSSIDMISILKKQRQEVLDFRISVEGERVKEDDTERSPFRKVHIHYFFKGNLDPAKVERAVKLSMEKYCSATAQFEPLAEITHEITIEG